MPSICLIRVPAKALPRWERHLVLHALTINCTIRGRQVVARSLFPLGSLGVSPLGEKKKKKIRIDRASRAESRERLVTTVMGNYATLSAHAV